MTISGIMPLRNAVKLGYPFELAIRSLRPLCDEVVVLVDPTSEDDTLERVKALSPDRIVESAWDMTNHAGHVHGEIAKQTARACEAASGDWILSLQADEVLHEGEVGLLREAMARAEREGRTGIEMKRLYFYGDLGHIRDDWTVWLLRLFRKGHWAADPVSGAMQFIAATEGERRMHGPARIYHYSRVGDPMEVARRVRNLDLFYHLPATVGEVEEPYDFTKTRKLDTYVKGHVAEVDPAATLTPFTGTHPAGVREHFGV